MHVRFKHNTQLKLMKRQWNNHSKQVSKTPTYFHRRTPILSRKWNKLRTNLVSTSLFAVFVERKTKNTAWKAQVGKKKKPQNRCHCFKVANFRLLLFRFVWLLTAVLYSCSDVHKLTRLVNLRRTPPSSRDVISAIYGCRKESVHVNAYAEVLCSVII